LPQVSARRAMRGSAGLGSRKYFCAFSLRFPQVGIEGRICLYLRRMQPSTGEVAIRRFALIEAVSKIGSAIREQQTQGPDEETGYEKRQRANSAGRCALNLG